MGLSLLLTLCHMSGLYFTDHDTVGREKFCLMVTQSREGGRDLSAYSPCLF